MTTASQLSLIANAATALKRAGVPVLIKDGPYLELPHSLVVRVMPDPGHVDRVHLRSVSDAGEISITTRKPHELGKLVQYAKVLIDGHNRKAAEAEAS